MRMRTNYKKTQHYGTMNLNIFIILSRFTPKPYEIQYIEIYMCMHDKKITYQWLCDKPYTCLFSETDFFMPHRNQRNCLKCC